MRFAYNLSVFGQGHTFHNGLKMEQKCPKVPYFTTIKATESFKCLQFLGVFFLKLTTVHWVFQVLNKAKGVVDAKSFCLKIILGSQDHNNKGSQIKIFEKQQLDLLQTKYLVCTYPDVDKRCKKR